MSCLEMACLAVKNDWSAVKEHVNQYEDEDWMAEDDDRYDDAIEHATNPNSKSQAFFIHLLHEVVSRKEHLTPDPACSANSSTNFAGSTAPSSLEGHDVVDPKGSEHSPSNSNRDSYVGLPLQCVCVGQRKIQLKYPKQLKIVDQELGTLLSIRCRTFVSI
jgi:hypothetical protein